MAFKPGIDAALLRIIMPPAMREAVMVVAATVYGYVMIAALHANTAMVAYKLIKAHCVMTTYDKAKSKVANKTPFTT